MATKGLGSIKDHVGAKFDGVAVSDLSEFIDKINTAFRVLEVKPETKYLVLTTQLEGRAWDIANKIVKKWEGDHDTTQMNAQQKRDNGEACFDKIVDELRTNPLVTGIKPISTMLNKFNTLTQGDKENVSVYHHRLVNLVEKLASQSPPEIITDLQVFNAFVGTTEATGLRPEFQRHVKLNGGTTLEEALQASG